VQSEGGFPWLMHEEDDRALLATALHATALITLSGAGCSWEARVALHGGECMVEIPLGDEEGEYLIQVQEETTGCVLKLTVPVEPIGGGMRGLGTAASGPLDRRVRQQHRRGEERLVWDSGVHDDQGSDAEPDEYEDDGFLVFDEGHEESHDSEGVEDDEEDAALQDSSEDGNSSWGIEEDEGQCAVCCTRTFAAGGAVESDPVLLCDGCDAEVHLRCAEGITEVPEGEWYCTLCTAQRRSASGRPEGGGASDSESDVGTHAPRRLRTGKRRRVMQLDSESDCE